ncbi:hypothetical protein JG688_00017768 [Phytophthora aleatoria]|uniref:Uncharacterized protein n=1 Tax=Phytophthora aleatoria TaxID=2496075 RepID=A0A8J5I9X2_9STRA|nr:hypothetical protein JG688_00017768 [Phytophthora aleatoria]
MRSSDRTTKLRTLFSEVRDDRAQKVLFEAIMFLKSNRAYWDSRLVGKAIKNAHTVVEGSTQ